MTCEGGDEPRVRQQPAAHPYTSRLPSVDRTGGDWHAEALHDDGVEVVHVHFGFETMTLEGLAERVRSVQRAGIGVVHTVHDLANPHLDDQAGFAELADLLAAEADAVLTLSEAAAAEVHRRTGRAPTVVPHGAIVPAAAARHLGGRRRRGLYVHAATCRPNLDVDVIETVADHATPWGGVDVHVRPPETARAAGVVERLAAHPGIRLDVRPRLTDQQLWRRLAGARATLLPYRWCTHSGLLEASHDLHTPVLAPDVGALVEQGAVVLRPDDVGASIEQAVSSCPPVDARLRAHQGRVSLDTHRRVYSEVRAARAGAVTVR